jgi:hypothetical protein
MSTGKHDCEIIAELWISVDIMVVLASLCNDVGYNG